MAQFKMVQENQLMEHPRNREFFDDIKDTDRGFWTEFKDSISQFGIIEPLLVNAETMQVRSGNQRLKAVRELNNEGAGIREIPVILVDPDDSESEIQNMIASNVYRRQISPFAMFKYIGMLRRGASGKKGRQKELLGSQQLSVNEVATKAKKDTAFVLVSDKFNSMSKEEQEELKQWYTEQENSKTEGELIAQLKYLQQQKLEADERYDELMDEKKSVEQREEVLEKMLLERDELINRLEETRDETSEENLNELDAEIRMLEKEKMALKKKVKELTMIPDINVFLEEAIRNQTKVNSFLDEIFGNWENCDIHRRDEFITLLERCYRTASEKIRKEDVVKYKMEQLEGARYDN